MQKLIGTDLYVFDLIPFEITQQTEAEVIYVQHECINGYKEANPSLADKMKGFNQFTITVTDPWAGGVEPTPVTEHTITLNGTNLEGNVTVKLNDQTVELESSYTAESSTVLWIYPTQDTSDYTAEGLAWNNEEHAFWTGFDEDKTVSLTYTEPQPQTYTATITGSGINGDTVEVHKDQQTIEFASEYELTEGEGLEVFYKEDASRYTAVSTTGWAWDENEPAHWYIDNGIHENVTLELSYTEPQPQTYHVSFSNDSDAAGDVYFNPVSGDQVAGQFFEVFFANGKTGYDISVTSSDVQVSWSQAEGGNAEHYYFVMPDHDIEIAVKYKTVQTITISGLPYDENDRTIVAGLDPNNDTTWLPVTWDSGNSVYIGSYEVGQPFQFDERQYNVDSMSPTPSQSSEALWSIGQSYEMTNTALAVTLSLKQS